MNCSRCRVAATSLSDMVCYSGGLACGTGTMSDSVKTVRATARDGQTKELLRLTRKRSRHRFKQPAQFAAERLVATASISDFGLPIPHFRNPQLQPSRPWRECPYA